MKTIGITGGIGSGKSAVTDILRDEYGAACYKADDIANDIKEPGRECHRDIVSLLGKEILNKDGSINRSAMAKIIYSDKEKMQAVKDILYPAVKRYVQSEIKRLSDEGKTEYFVLEAALLIEEGYKDILDELWYVRADEDIRIERLIRTRGYSKEKAKSIIQTQLSDEEFIKNTDRIIENNTTLKAVKDQIKKIME